MKFWLDSANIEDIDWAGHSGFVSGVTVNPSLIAKEEKQDLAVLLQNIFDEAVSDWGMALSLPAIGKDAEELDLDAQELERVFGERISIKIPVSRETLPLIGAKSFGGVRVNATCIFTGLQAACAAAAGAKILSVFVGRINDDTPGFGWKVLDAAKTVAGDGAQVLAGSIRDKGMVGMACDHGADIVTASKKVLETLADDPGTERSVAKFNADFEAWKS
jgi:transaldolase